MLKRVPILFNPNKKTQYIRKQSLTSSHSYLEDFHKRLVDEGGVVGLKAGDGFKQAELLKGLADGERRNGVVGGQEERPSEPDAVESHGGYGFGDDVYGLFA